MSHPSTPFGEYFTEFKVGEKRLLWEKLTLQQLGQRKQLFDMMVNVLKAPVVEGQIEITVFVRGDSVDTEKAKLRFLPEELNHAAASGGLFNLVESFRS